jgi:hypothetical protein
VIRALSQRNCCLWVVKKSGLTVECVNPDVGQFLSVGGIGGRSIGISKVLGSPLRLPREISSLLVKMWGFGAT